MWVGGGRRGDGIVIAANRLAKKFGIKTGTACFEAKRLCPRGVLCRPHYDAYRELSRQMFLILEQYAPTLVPYSIDEGFLDFSSMDILTSLLRLRQICCHPALVDAKLRTAESAKLAALEELLEPLMEEGHKVLVFSQFVTMLDILRETVQQRGCRHSASPTGSAVDLFLNGD